MELKIMTSHRYLKCMYFIIIKLATINWELIDVSSDLLAQSDMCTFSRIISEWNTLP